MSLQHAYKGEYMCNTLYIQERNIFGQTTENQTTLGHSVKQGRNQNKLNLVLLWAFKDSTTEIALIGRWT